jgi:hypothetical protein
MWVLVGRKRFRSKNADLWKRLLVIYRNQVDFKWIKGTIIRRMNVVMYLVMATQSIPLSIDAFMRRRKEKFYENFASLLQ